MNAERKSNRLSATGRRFAIGVDYGTNSVRAVVVDLANGSAVGENVYAYPSGQKGILLDPKDPHVARQNPADYINGFLASVKKAVAQAKKTKGFTPSNVVGLGVDTTGSTPIPVDSHGTPLALKSAFKKDMAAHAWLWKDHTAHVEAAKITEKAKQAGVPYLAKCGGIYSSEWFWAKIWHCQNSAPKVFNAAYSWVELCDFIPAYITGNSDPMKMARSICAAGHKAMYSDDWGGLPEKEFLRSLSPELAELRDRLYSRAVPSDQVAGYLTDDIAKKIGLPSGLVVAVGAFDAHHGAVGAGVKEGTLVKIIGTSTCDLLVAPAERELKDIPGVCGIVPDSVIPGMYGLEAGQSAVGDIFNWFVDQLCPSRYAKGDKHANLTSSAAKLKPGESGLIALDWNNGNRTVLVDPLLSGLLLGQTLHTTAPEIYRALVESTAFGALKIIQRFEEYGVEVKEVVNCGGIAEKNPFIMQIYADICNRPMKISRSTQTCALGAAIFGAVAAGAFKTVSQAQKLMTGVKSTVYKPIRANALVYERIYELYSSLHDSFGTDSYRADMNATMKDLISIRTQVRSSKPLKTVTASAHEANMDLQKLKEAVCKANCDLVKHGLVTLTWGNASGIDRKLGLVVIKPSGVAYENMRPSDMVVIDLEGNVIAGDLNPSTDTPTHLALYNAWPQVGGIVHTHSTCATMFAQACKPIQCLGTTHADYVAGEIPVTRPLTNKEVEAAYELNTGKVILSRFRRLSPAEIPGVLVANHAPFTWGPNVQKAVDSAITMEEVACMAFGATQINPEIRPVSDYILNKHYSRKHGSDAYYGQGKDN